MKHKTSKRKESSGAKAFLLGILLNAIVFFVLIFLSSVILSRLRNPLKASALASFCALILSGAISGFFAARYKGEGRILPSGICAFVFALALFFASMICGGGKIPAITTINLIIYVAVAFLFASLRRGKKKRRR